MQKWNDVGPALIIVIPAKVRKLVNVESGQFFAVKVDEQRAFDLSAYRLSGSKRMTKTIYLQRSRHMTLNDNQERGIN